jgi:prepilin-type processing-associated H-X9-DG protein
MDTSTDGNHDRGAAASVPSPPLQFGLRTIFVVTAIVAILTAGTTAGGAVGFFAAMFAICAALMLIKRKQFGIVGAFGCAFSLIMSVALSLPAVNGGGPSPRNECSNSMKQLALGLLNYADKQGHFPPAFVSDSLGRPLHSWRTLLLPEVEEGKLYSRYDLSQPWDSPQNSKVIQANLACYECPVDENAATSTTSYVAVIAPGSVWSVPGGAKLSQITDGPANTILLVEMKNSGIKWAEPRDLDLSNLPPGTTKQYLLHSLSNHAGGFNAVFADAHVEFIPETIPWADFEAMLTIAGGEKVDRSKW